VAPVTAPQEPDRPDPHQRVRLTVLDHFWLWLLGGMLRPIKFKEEAVRAIREKLAGGIVVHVLPYRSYLDWLILVAMFRRNGLPLAPFPDHSVWLRLFYGALAWLSRLFRRG